jgi:DUF1680 family protein
MNRSNLLWVVVAVFLAMKGTESARATPGVSGGNLAVFAAVTASGDEAGAATVASGVMPQNSWDDQNGMFRIAASGGTQWVELAWPAAISTSRVEIYWRNDYGQVRVPEKYRLEYFDGSRFDGVANARGLGVERDRFNVTTFNEVTTTRMRVEIEPAEGHSAGMLQWRVVDSGKSPVFAPKVAAGPDRIVVLPGATYLNGEVRTAAANEAKLAVAWRKVSGPGEVRFADASSAVTSAHFERVGDYVLELSAGVGNARSSATLSVKAVELPAAVALTEVHPQPFKLTSPLWNARIKALIVRWIPHCIEEIEDPNQKTGGLENFIQAGNKLAGRPYRRHVGFPFANAWVHNTVESMCLALMVDPQGDREIIAAQEQMRQTLERWIEIILAAQEPDGYLQTRFTLGTDRDPEGANPPRWDPAYRGEHEGYVAGYFIEAAMADYFYTGGKDRRMYDAAKKLADCWCAHIGPPPKKEWFDGHEEIEQALVRFGRLVNEVEGNGRGQKYIDLAKFLLDCRGGGGTYDQSQATVTRQYEAVGHAVRAVYCYRGMADVAMADKTRGTTDYESAVESIWNNLVNTKFYVTGGVGSGETSEGFGGDYSLPNKAYCESCSGCGMLFLQHDLNLARGDAKYADLVEQTLYNAVLGDLDLAGNNFTYTNSLDETQARYPWHDCPCCVGNFPRTMLMLPTWMYATDAGGLYVNQFVGSTVELGDVAGGKLGIEQQTDYPWSGKVRLVISPEREREFAIHIRLPRRDVSALYSAEPVADGADSIAVNGAAVTPAVEKGYAVITRKWRAGDVIDIALPMKVQRVKASERVKADEGRVALRYGPLVFNIESVDQDVEQVLAGDSPLKVAWRGDLLGGVMVIEGRFADGSALLAVPNYARCNRGGRSVVWIRER